LVVIGWIIRAQLFIVLPAFTAAQAAPRWAITAPSIRLLDANVYYLNGTSMVGYSSEIKAYQAHLVTMEEATPFLAKQLKKSEYAASHW